MNRFFFPLCLFMAVVLVAQAPSAKETSLARKYKTEEPIIETLLKDLKGKEAMAKVESLVPATKPPFDRSGPQATLKSREEYIDLVQIYFLAAKASRFAGDWERAKDYFAKAVDTAKETKAECTAGLGPLMETWNKAIASSQKALEEGGEHIKALEAKSNRDANEEQELKNFRIHQNNIKQGPVVLKQLGEVQKELDAYIFAPAANAEVLDKNLKSEQEELLKFKGKKAGYVKAAMAPSNLDHMKTTADKVFFLNRLAFLDPGNKTVQAKLNQLLGKEPAKPVQKKKRK